VDFRELSAITEDPMIDDRMALTELLQRGAMATSCGADKPISDSYQRSLSPGANGTKATCVTR
jgi:hypothetical protein